MVSRSNGSKAKRKKIHEKKNADFAYKRKKGDADFHGYF